MSLARLTPEGHVQDPGCAESNERHSEPPLGEMARRAARLGLRRSQGRENDQQRELPRLSQVLGVIPGHGGADPLTARWDGDTPRRKPGAEIGAAIATWADRLGPGRCRGVRDALMSPHEASCVLACGSSRRTPAGLEAGSELLHCQDVLMHRHRARRGWTRGVPIGDRGPGESYRPEDVAPSVFGPHQPGIVTPVLDHLVFAALDLLCPGRPELAELMRKLTAEAERLMRAAHNAPSHRRPAGGLTLTFGFGPDLFDERFGLASQRPVALGALPAFPGDTVDSQTSGGDLGVQVCAESAATAAQALARLIAVDRRAVQVRWSQRAAMHRWPGERPEGRPRNLLGFKEATANPRRGKDLARHVWVKSRERSWMIGGTFLVVRKVRVLLDDWNALSLEQQERVIGRHRDSGAPLGRRHEFEAMPLDDDTVPADAHARLANPRADGGLTVLRRGYSYDDGPDEQDRADAGLMLLLYGRDPRRQFIPLQRRLAQRDALTAFTRTVGSAIFAIPPGAQAGQPLAHQLIEA
jgi:deferrochelatase/peroxidase EfeB